MKALILAGDGINCEKETAAAAKETGFKAQIVHVNDFLEREGRDLSDARLLAIPGGFAFGDELGSGQILALKLRHGLKGALDRFIQNRGAVFGICNGFQVLTRLGVFGHGVALTQNEQGHFLNRWVGLKITGRSIFTDGLRARGVDRLELPIRHGEGRLLFTDPGVAAQVESQGGFVLKYEEDVNGAWDSVAGLSACEGRVMGMMPHPEAFWSEELHPAGESSGLPLGIELFRSAYNSLRQESA